jgi:hypothetical protein
MKNIHILPTTQPSRFSLHTTGLYNLACELHENSPNFSNHHIYITSDEEIKEGDYCVDGNDIYGPYEDGDIATDKFIKIILTTDSQLIRYGVQAIDDEFLEWFVENPTCEFVEVEEIGPGFPAGIYWINYLPEHFEKSIPQEEPKQYPMGSFASGNYWHKECVTCKKEFMGDKRAVQCESCAIELTKQFTQKEPKQEKGLALLLKKQERMYSEEDLRQAFRDGQSNMHYSDNFGLDSSLTEQQWFENFKKK